MEKEALHFTNIEEKLNEVFNTGYPYEFHWEMLARGSAQIIRLVSESKDEPMLEDASCMLEFYQELLTAVRPDKH